MVDIAKYDAATGDGKWLKAAVSILLEAFKSAELCADKGENCERNNLTSNAG